MAHYIGPKCRLCRREGQKLYLKGSRCESEKCAFTRRQQAPGQHGNKRRRRMSDYGIQFREKQKAKRIYGVLEKKFKRYVSSALKSKGITGETLMQSLETRFDNMVYRSGFAVSRAQARQFIGSGLFMINGRVCKVPSRQLHIGDIIKPIDFRKIHLREGFILPEWLKANVKEKYVEFSEMPTLEEIGKDVNVQLIVEFYSR